MSKKFDAYNLNDILSFISDVISHKEVNVSKMTKEIGIPRSSFYEFLYKDSKDLKRIQKLCSYLSLKIKVELAD